MSLKRTFIWPSSYYGQMSVFYLLTDDIYLSKQYN